MLTIAQIYAVIGLLMAFGVPQNTVTQVQDILLPQQQQVSQAPVGIVGDFGVVAGPVSRETDCTPLIETHVSQLDAATYEFYATSTAPVGCTFTPNTQADLETPGVRYVGTIGNWIRNNGSLSSDNTVFTYHQKWGQSPYVKKPGDAFIWHFDKVTVRVELP